MSASTSISPPVPDDTILSAIAVLQREAKLPKMVDVFTKASITEATGYRRIKKPGDITVAELHAIAVEFGVPAYVITEGDLATLRWLREPHGGPDGPGGQENTSTIWYDGQIVPFRTRERALVA